MDFGDKVAGAELPGSESRASGPHPTFDSTKSPDWAYDEGAPGAGAFRILRVIFDPEAADHISGVFIL